MTNRDLAPLAGVLFVAMIVAAFLVSGSTPEGDASARAVVSYYTGHEAETAVTLLLVGLSVLPLLYFASWLRERAGAALPESSALPGMVLGAGVLAAAGIGVAAGVPLALAQYADDVSPAAAQALNALDTDVFFAFLIGLMALVLATSLVALRSELLPAWFGWVGVALFAVTLSPLGFLGFVGSGLWLAGVSVVLYRRSSPAAVETTSVLAGRSAAA